MFEQQGQFSETGIYILVEAVARLEPKTVQAFCLHGLNSNKRYNCHKVKLKA
ncbi:hypothetical protein GCM10011500_19560 [Mucilaginibacter rubeus]|nr:hypothetical protein GCM10011500_19560 [Mucilaginibacter rubeus]